MSKFSIILKSIIVLFIFEIILEKWLTKKKKIIKPKGLFSQHVNSLHKKLDWLLIFIYLVSVFLFDNISASFCLFFLSLMSLKAFMEWKYEREKKQYIFSLVTCILFSTFLIIMILIEVNM